MDRLAEIDPVGNWERTKERHNALHYEHPNTGDEILLLRLIGSVPKDSPVDTSDPDNVCYVIRYLSDRVGSDWIDITTVKERSEAQSALLETMRILEPAQLAR
jgi:hypothetical protein